MNRSYFNWILLAALAGLVIVGIFMWQESHKKPDQTDNAHIARPVSPFRSYISGMGIVESSSENINIGSPLNRVVKKVFVSVGEKVKANQILFQLESRDLEADLQTKHIDYENAVVNLQKLEALPRTEDLLAASASLKSAELALKQAGNRYERVEGLQVSGAMSVEEVMQRKYSHEEADAQYQKAKADFEKIKAGAWLPDIEIAKLKVQLAKAEQTRIETEIGRTIITAPIAATVLQIKIHEGEFPPPDSARNPPMIIGNTDSLHVRVNINQYDASFFNPEAPAIAYMQGNANVSFPLTFVRLEPFFVAKQTLSNDIAEQVDTRVLQAIYSFTEGKERVFVGQQMDVFIETKLEGQE